MEPVICTSEIMTSLRERLLEELSPKLHNKDVLHLDVPIHLNVGDMLIDMGTDQLFLDAGVRSVERVSVLDQARFFHRVKKVSENAVLILHGGGNFGDLYPHHQEFRSRVVARFPNNPILVFPQSVHFSSQAFLKEQVLVYQQHSNLTFFARDQYSFDLLSPFLNEGQLRILPDLAHMLYGRFPMQESCDRPCMLFRRRDIEAVEKLNQEGFDWSDIVTSELRSKFRSLKKQVKWQGRLKIDFGAHSRWRGYRDALVDAAIEEYGKYNIVDSDRLHGVILAHILGKPVVARDNCYGKIRRYVETHFDF